MKGKLLITFCLILYFAGITNAQQTISSGKSYIIKGIVVDGIDKFPVDLAAVGIFNAKDSTLIKGGQTGDEGDFELKNLAPGDYYLSVSFIGYEPTIVDISSKSFSETVINLGTLNMHMSSFMMDEIEVVATLPEVVMKGDTTQYNADAYELEENAPLEDLLGQLPGMEVDPEDGSVTSNTGNLVTRIFIDGEEMFADDPEWVLKNWPAYMVDKIEIYERKSEQALLTGVDDGIRETVINITTKKEMKLDMLVGDIQGGIGALLANPNDEGPRYSGNATVTRTTDRDKYTVRANINNINNRPLDRPAGRLGGRGINRTNNYGINIQKNPDKTLKVLTDLNYKNDKRYTDQHTFRENIYPDSVSYRTTSSNSRSNNHNLFFRGTLEYRPDTATTFILKPEFSFNRSVAENGRKQITRAGDRDSSLVNSSESLNNSLTDDYNAKLHFDISKLMSEKGRRVSLSGSFRYNTRDGETFKESENLYYRTPENNKEETQQSLIDNKRFDYYLNLAYVEPVGKGNFINLTYNIEYNRSDNNNKTYDFDPETNEYTILNDNYSRNSGSNHLKQSARLNFTSDKEKYHYNIGIHVTPNRRSSKTYIKDWFGAGQDSILNSPPAMTDINYAPQLYFVYRFRNDTIRTNLNIRYNGRTQLPSLSQLDPTPNNNNPLRIQSGNPDLSGAFIHNMTIEFNENDVMSLKNLKATLSFNLTQNQIINFTSYDAATGVEYIRPVNRNGSWNGALNVFYTKPLDKEKRLKFNTQTRLNYRNQLGYTTVNNQSVENNSKVTEVTETLSLNHKLEKYRGDIKLTFRYSQNRYTYNKDNKRESFRYEGFYKPSYKFTEQWSLSNEFFLRFSETHYTINDNNTYDIDFVCKPILKTPYNWIISNEVRYLSKRGMSAGYDTKEVIWNTVISKQILNKKGTISLQFNDILQDSKNISRRIETDFYEDTQYTALTSYFMISFNYHLNEFLGKKKGKQDS